MWSVFLGTGKIMELNFDADVEFTKFKFNHSCKKKGINHLKIKPKIQIGKWHFLPF